MNFKENLISYKEKLKDPLWQKKRIRIFERDNFCCQRCKATEKPLQVHHLVYLPGKDPWEYPDNYLLTLCHKCHERERLMLPYAVSELIRSILIMGLLSDEIIDLSVKKEHGIV